MSAPGLYAHAGLRNSPQREVTPRRGSRRGGGRTIADRLSEQGNKLLQDAAQKAGEFGRSEVDTEHLLLALTSSDVVRTILEQFKIDADDLARQIFNLWMSSPGHKANQMDDYNAYGAIAVMYGQPQEYNGRKIVNFSAVFSFANQDLDFPATWENQDMGMGEVLGMTENDYNLITNYFIR